MNLTIEMPWERDLSVNHYKFGKGGGYRKKPHVQAWMDRLKLSVFFDDLIYERDKQRAPFQPKLNLPVSVVVHFRFPNKRRRDDDNYYKVIKDAVAAGLGIDDKDIRISTGTMTVDRQNPGFTIEVSDETDD